MNNETVVIGCGGHSRTILNILIQENKDNVVGLYDLNEFDSNETILGIPVLGNITELLDQTLNRKVNLYLAIGDNCIRQNWFERLNDIGYTLKNLISSSANISINATFGIGSLVCSQVYVGPEASIGSNSIINTSSIIEHETKIGAASHIAPGCTIAGRTTIGNRVFIGAGSTVVDNISICDDVIIGAGSTVINSITVPGTYVGVPAKILK